MVAHDPKSGKTTTPTYRATDGTFPHDPQINAPDRDVATKPAARHSGYVKGGTTNPSAGEPSEPTYYDPSGKEVEPQVVLSEPWRGEPGSVGRTRGHPALRATGPEAEDPAKESYAKDAPVDLPVGPQEPGKDDSDKPAKGRRDLAAEAEKIEKEAAANAKKAAEKAKA